MEYLVTMTTNVPAGTSEDEVQIVRGREAQRSSQLASQGHLLRLWRPPLQPGEWRTLGLFAANDSMDLETVLASMPLRVWRSDTVTPLSAHVNDPAGGAKRPGAGAATPTAGANEFLTTFALAEPGTQPESDWAGGLDGQGGLERLWALPGPGRVLGLWQTTDLAAMSAILTSLPLPPGLSGHTTPLTAHPSDPALVNG